MDLLLQCSGSNNTDQRLHPSMTDYCDTCKYLKEQPLRNQATINRSQQSGNALESDLRSLESMKHQLEEELAEHKEVATKSREYYKASTDKCKKEWNDIVRFTNMKAVPRSDREELERKKNCFTLSISADYQ